MIKIDWKIPTATEIVKVAIRTLNTPSVTAEATMIVVRANTVKM